MYRRRGSPAAFLSYVVRMNVWMRTICDVRRICDELVFVYVTNDIQMLAIQMRLDRVTKIKETSKQIKMHN